MAIFRRTGHLGHLQVFSCWAVADIEDHEPPIPIGGIFCEDLDLRDNLDAELLFMSP
jgi:hypothetical protein